MQQPNIGAQGGSIFPYNELVSKAKLVNYTVLTITLFLLTVYHNDVRRIYIYIYYIYILYTFYSC